MAGAVGGCGPVHTLMGSLCHRAGVMEWPTHSRTQSCAHTHTDRHTYKALHVQTQEHESLHTDWIQWALLASSQSNFFSVLYNLGIHYSLIISGPVWGTMLQSPYKGRQVQKKKKVLRGLPSLSTTPVSSVIMNSGGKREKHILHSNLFMVPEGPLSPDEGPPPPLPLLIDMWNPSLSAALKAVPVCVWKVLIVE